MERPNILQVDREAMGHRRHLAKLRHEREAQRRALLLKLMKSHRRATHLRSWIDDQENCGTARSHPAIRRMIEWAQEQLAALEAVAAPGNLIQSLHVRELFPEVDEFRDPLGEPQARRPWGR